MTLYNIENYVTNSVKKRNIEKLCHKQREKRILKNDVANSVKKIDNIYNN